MLNFEKLKGRKQILLLEEFESNRKRKENILQKFDNAESNQNTIMLNAQNEEKFCGRKCWNVLKQTRILTRAI